jgi:hypothetical protein
MHKPIGPMPEWMAPRATLSTRGGKNIRHTVWEQTFWAMMINEFIHSPLRKAGDLILTSNGPRRW